MTTHLSYGMQPARLIRLHLLDSLGIAKDSRLLQADSKDSDQNYVDVKLIKVFTAHKFYKVQFLMLQHIYQ